MQFAVKILIEAGHFFVTPPASEQEAKQIVRDWHSGAYAIRGAKRLGDPEYGWSVELRSILAMHIVQIQPQPVGPSVSPRAGSGFFPN